jgi:hypothetical protein
MSKGATIIWLENKVSVLVYVYIRVAVCSPLEYKNPRLNHKHDVPTGYAESVRVETPTPREASVDVNAQRKKLDQ